MLWLAYIINIFFPYFSDARFQPHFWGPKGLFIWYILSIYFFPIFDFIIARLDRPFQVLQPSYFLLCCRRKFNARRASFPPVQAPGEGYEKTQAPNSHYDRLFSVFALA